MSVMVERPNTQHDKSVPPKKKWRTVKCIAIIALLVIAGAAVKLYLSFRIHLDELPPEQSMKYLHDFIGDTQYPSIAKVECSVLAGFHLDHFEWYRFNCSPEDIEAIITSIAARPSAGEWDTGTATFEKATPVDGEQYYSLVLNNELYRPSYFNRFDPEWWNKDTLNGLEFFKITTVRAGGNTTYEMFYNREKQMVYLSIVEG